ncbi:MAG: 2-C-methyl-D-erythritol 4-phosphate cytidylyltransferase [Holdemanella sp.]|nr:2-C-methyl-D-erythritol 4-phosphate cytidylyltransferase [Holdemanella sp.]
MKYSVCLLAAGKGSRTKLEYNKMFYPLKEGKTVLDVSLQPFLMDTDCKQIIIVCAEHEINHVEKLYKEIEKIEVAIGGSTRQESVYNGLSKVVSPYVFIHDGARPYLKEEQIYDLKKTLEKEDACLLMVPSVDTVKIVEEGYVKETLIRANVYNAQTPQCFKTDLIKKCHEMAKVENRIGTDDAQLVEWYGNSKVKVVIGDASNTKITLPTDLK